MEEMESAWIGLHTDEELTTDSLISVFSEVDKLIEIAEKQKQGSLIKLLKKSTDDFNGVREFVDLPDDAFIGWSLSIVILTSIAVQLPNIPRREINELRKGVTKGLHFVTLIEKSLNVNSERYRLYPGTGYGFWNETFWTPTRLKIKEETYEETWKAVEDLARNATEILSSGESFDRSKKMTPQSVGYISSAIVRYIRENPEKTEANLFEGISVMIADLLCACLTNLSPLITSMCTNSAIEAIDEWEENVREAAITFGQTREILKMLRRRMLPALDPEKAAHLHEWRSFMEQYPNWMEEDIENTATTPVQSNEE